MFSFLEKKAMQVLGVTSQQLALAKLLSTQEKIREWARRKLRVTTKDLQLIQNAKAHGGLEKYLFNRLGIEGPDDLKEFKIWKRMNKVQKIKQLCPNPENIRDFFNQAYLHYKQIKKKVHTSWKKESAKEHIIAIQNRCHKMIVTDEMTVEDFQFIAVKSFMACWCFLNAVGKNSDKILNHVEMRMAA